jgi:1,2-diacylglycerol 3-alpha-glucosyltransferase
MPEILMKVLFLTNIPTPYNIPLLLRLRQESSWDFRPCFAARTNSSAAWRSVSAERIPGLDAIFLSRRAGGRFGSARAAVALVRELVQWRPDYLIISGYTRAPQLAALSWAILTATPFAVMGDSNVYANPPKGVRAAAKTVWLRYLTRKAAALISVGRANRLFWLSYGARPEKLFHAGFAVDNGFFERARADCRDEAAALRARLGLTGRTVFLYVGRFVPSKRVDVLINAVAALPQDEVGLLLVGDGPERQRLEATSAGRRNVHFAGAVENATLPLYHGAADVLVLPSCAEPWGLVVNEAMASGLAVIVHRRCGAAVDLVNDSNGVLLDDVTVGQMAAAMRRITASRSELARMRENASNTIRRWSIPAFASGIIRAVELSRAAACSAAAKPDGLQAVPGNWL